MICTKQLELQSLEIRRPYTRGLRRLWFPLVEVITRYVAKNHLRLAREEFKEGTDNYYNYVSNRSEPIQTDNYPHDCPEPREGYINNRPL